jgi:hypothetical protein
MMRSVRVLYNHPNPVTFKLNQDGDLRMFDDRMEDHPAMDHTLLN